MPRLGMIRIAEGERIETGDRGRAPMVNTSRRMPPTPVAAPWIGLDVARVVVALHLEHDGEPVADVDDAPRLARPLDHPGRLGRQVAEMHLRGFVRAVLVPHRREDAEFGEAWLPPDQVENALVLLRLEAVFGDSAE